MSLIGQLKEFDRAKESFEAYIERLESFMKANGVKEENKVAVLLTVIGPETYGLLRNLLTPEKPDSKEYEELVDILKGHLHPKPLVIAERFNFHNRFRVESETVSDFAAQLKKLSTHCEFGNFLDEALRDRFVCGLRKESIQKKLLSEKTLDFSKAMEIAQSMEMKEKKSMELKELGAPGSAQVQDVYQLKENVSSGEKYGLITVVETLGIIVTNVNTGNTGAINVESRAISRRFVHLRSRRMRNMLRFLVETT